MQRKTIGMCSRQKLTQLQGSVRLTRALYSTQNPDPWDILNEEEEARIVVPFRGCSMENVKLG